jgi:hypothetical protein
LKGIIYTFTVIISLGLCSYFWPKEGFQYQGISLQFIRFEELFPQPKQITNKNSLDGKKIVAEKEKKIYPAYEGDISHKLIQFEDLSEADLEKFIDSLRRIKRDSISSTDFKESVYLINPPYQNASALDPFFDALNEIEQGKDQLYRVNHYGDSQIEGDRMTITLRNLFQKFFSGNGYGFIPFYDVTTPLGYERKLVGSWNHYKVFGGQKHPQKKYGPGGTSFSYNGQGNPEPYQQIQEEKNNPSIHLQLQKSFSEIGIWYGKGKTGSKVYIWSDSIKIAEAQLDDSSQFRMIRIPLQQAVKNIQCYFSGMSPVLYGISLDPKRGIQFDNFGLRGHSGDGIMTLQVESLQLMYQVLNTKLAIIQFGGNITPYLKSEKTMAYMKEVYKNMYRHFKKALPEASVLVLSINDVSRSVNGQYESYPNISEFRYIQRELAIESGCAFFDLYQFMGGHSSIALWNRKNLAAKDGHLTEESRELVSKELFKALMYEYNQYKKRISRQEENK